jgi:hypothetical protein
MNNQNDERFPTFSEFMESLTATKREDYMAKPATKVATDDHFAEMKSYLLKLYDGVSATHSFVDENGQIFDCVPIEQQPALKGAKKIAHAADQPGAPEPSHELQAQSQLSPERKDKYGNSMWCPPGTVAVRRITMDELARFEDMRNFFQKSPAGGRHPRLGSSNTKAVSGTHQYAHAFQNVKNLGGRSKLNIWTPAVDPSIHTFSLSQQWYAAGSPVQTVEVGYQIYPQKYNTFKPVFFIYWTADGYNNTGCYNLDCSAFVQTNSSWIIGGALSTSSNTGGTQYEIDVSYYLFQGNWWLYVGGGAASNAIGYYKASQFGTGPLATNADNIDYGGEVVNVTSFPAMGSGAFASEGWQRAAYQSGIEYFPTTGGKTTASLTASQPSPGCYTINLLSAAAPWSSYFFYGGPGGASC